MDTELEKLQYEVYLMKRVDWNIDNPYNTLTSDYLLEKLPTFIGTFDDHADDYLFSLQASFDRSEWRAMYLGLSGKPLFDESSDTPLKALLNITIALHDAGELDGQD